MQVRENMPQRIAAVAGAALGLMLCMGLPAVGQTAPAGQTPAKPPATASPAQAPAAGQQAAPQQAAPQQAAPQTPPVNQEEEDAYKAFYLLTSQQNEEVITQGEAFLAKFPTSRYRSSVYSRLVNAYMNTHQAAKMVATGEKAVAENPDNVDVLAVLSTIIPRTVDPRSLDADQKLSEAERYARHAIELLGAMQPPPGQTPEQFDRAKSEMLGLAHYGLGLVGYMRGDNSVTVVELEQATKLDPQPEPLEFYLLGTGYMRQKKFQDAATSFDRCATAPWDPQWQARCKKGAEDAKQQAAATPAAPAPAKP